jgi:hypothetical protein
MPVNKSARNRSADPAQEHLRQRKQDWNSACSEFIARLNGFKPHLISFKRGLNGRGDAKAGLPISDIKNPLPAEIGGYLGAVSSEFNELASVFSQLVGEAGGIMQEQSQYAQRRRKPYKRQASAMQVDDGLTITASSSLSRFWANLAAIWSSDPLKAERLSMLKMAHELFESFVDFEDEVLVKGVSNVHQVLTQYFLVSNKLNALNLSLQKIRTAKERQEALLSRQKPVKPNSDDAGTAKPTAGNESATPTDKPSPPPPRPDDVDFETAPIEKLRELAVFMAHYLGLGLTIEDIRPFLEVCTSIKLERNPQTKEQLEDRARDVFKDLFSAVKDRFAEKFNVKVSPEATLGDLYDVRYKKASSLEDELTKYSGNALSRLIKKIKHQFGGKDASSASRMEIYAYIREAKGLTDQLMDLLEKKHLDLDTAMEKVSKLDELIIKIAEPLKILNVLYKDKFYENKKKKKVDPTLDPAGRYFTKQVRRDVDKPGW